MSDVYQARDSLSSALRVLFVRECVCVCVFGENEQEDYSSFSNYVLILNPETFSHIIID